MWGTKTLLVWTSDLFSEKMLVVYIIKTKKYTKVKLNKKVETSEINFVAPNQKDGVQSYLNKKI